MKAYAQRSKHVKTCVLAREICPLVHTNRALLGKEDEERERNANSCYEKPPKMMEKS